MVRLRLPDVSAWDAPRLVLRPHERSARLTLRTAIVATYPPRHCGIAAFTHDLVRATGSPNVVALHPPGAPALYPREVRHRIRRDVAADYGRTAASLADDGVELVSIQHEYGIWGGDDGELVLDFVRALRMPVVATLHTVRRTPTPSQHRILARLCAAVDGVVVMSQAAATLLARVYGVSPTRISVIPHGVPDLPRVDPELVKPGLGLAGRAVILSFGLIWLDHLRNREPKIGIDTLAIFLPSGLENTTCHRVRHLSGATYMVFVHQANDEAMVDPRDYQNFDTRLPIAMRALAGASRRTMEWVDRLLAVDGVERRDRPDGSVSLAVRGLEFARVAGDELLFGFDRKHAAGGEAHIAEAERIAQELARMRNCRAIDRGNPLYMRHPEAWLESQVRAEIETLDAMLHPYPLYGQVPQFAAGERGIIDLLGADRDGRLAVIELKAGEDIHLP